MNTHNLATEHVIDLLPGRDEACFVIRSAFSQNECEELLFQANLRVIETMNVSK